MVVSNDHLDAAVLKLLHRIDIGNAAVNRDHEVRVLLNDLVHDLLRKPVAVLGPVRNDVIDLNGMAPEISHQD